MSQGLPPGFQLESAPSATSGNLPPGFQLEQSSNLPPGFQLEQPKPEPQSGGFLGNTIGAGIHAAGTALDAFATAGATAGGMVAESLGQAAAGKFGWGDAAFKAAHTFADGDGYSFRNQAAHLNKDLGTVPGETAQKIGTIAGNVGTLAAGIPAAIGVMGAQAVTHAGELVEKYNVQPEVARNIALVSYAANAAFGGLFPWAAGGILEKAGMNMVLGKLSPYAASGVGNVAQGAATRAGEKAYLGATGNQAAADATPAWDDLESMAGDFAFGAAAHGFNRDHPVQKAPPKTNTTEDIHNALAVGDRPDPNLTDVDTSNARNPYQTGLGRTLTDGHEEVPNTGEKVRAMAADPHNEQQAHMDRLAMGEEQEPSELASKKASSGKGSPKIIEDARGGPVSEQVSGKTGPKGDIPDLPEAVQAQGRVLDALNDGLQKQRQNRKEAVAQKPLDPAAKMAGENGRALTPDEQAIEAQMNEGSPAHEIIAPIAVPRTSAEKTRDAWWDGGWTKKTIESLIDPKTGRIDPMIALKWVEKNSAPHLRLASKALQRFPGLMKSLDIEALGPDKFNGAANKNRAAGVYGPTLHKVWLGHAQGRNDAVLIHEMIHAATSRALYISEMLPGHFPNIDALAREISMIRAKVAKEGGEQEEQFLDKSGKPVRDNTYDFSHLDKDLPRRSRVYGLSNIHEFISEAFSNDHFRSMLEKMGAFASLKDSIARWLGKENMTGLDQILKLSDAIGSEHEKNRREISEALAREQKAGIARGDPKWTGEAATKLLFSPMREIADEGTKRGADKDPKDEGLKNALPSGVRNMNIEAIPKAPAAEKVLAGLKTVKDISTGIKDKMIQNFTVSGEMIARLMKNQGFYDYARILDRGQKTGHFYEETVIKPLIREIKRTIPDSNWKSLSNVMKVMQAEDSYRSPTHPDGKRLSPEQLSAHLNPSEQKVYKMLRENFDKAMDHTNAAEKAAGLEPTTRREAYAASVRSGPWSSEIYHKNARGDEEMIGYIRGHSIVDVRRGIEAAKKEYPNAYTKQDRPQFNKAFNGTKGDNIYQALNTYERLFGKEDPGTVALRQKIEDAAAKEGTNFQSFNKRLMDKSGLRYAEGDRPWVSDRKNVQDWFKNQTETMGHAYKWGEMQKSLTEAKKVISDPEFNASHPNMSTFLREYTRGQLGFGKSDAATAMEHAIAEWVGHAIDTVPGLRNLPVDMHASMVAMRAAKSLLYLKALGFWKPQHLIVNGVFQPLFTLARHSMLSAQGFAHNPFVTMHEGILNSNRILLDHYTNGVSGLTAKQKEMAEYIKSSNLATNNPFQDLGDIGSTGMSKLQTGVTKVGGFFMQEGERICRVNAFCSYVSHLEQSGKFGDNRAELYREAERHTTETMGSFRHTDRPAAFVKMGQVGTGLATLQQFKINFLNQNTNYLMHGLETKNFTPFMVFNATQLMMAGVMGLVGFEEIDALWKHIRDLIPSGMIDAKLATWSPKQWVMEHAHPALARGPVSTVTGINFASSLEAGSVVDPSVQGMFPFLSEIKNTFGPPVEYLRNPTQDNLHKMIWNETPYGSRGWLETGKAFGQDLPEAINTRSWYTSPTGVSQSPNNPGQGKFTRNENDELLRSSGFTSTREAQIKEGDFMQQENNKVIEERQKDMVDKLDSAIRNNDLNKGGDAIMQYMKLEGDPTKMLANDRINKLLIDWNTDYNQRVTLGVKSGDIGSIYKYQRLHEMIDGLEKYYGPANAARK